MHSLVLRNCVLAATFAFAALGTLVGLRAQAPADFTTDKYIWLEDVNSTPSLEWVKTENARTAKILEADPRFAAYQADALKIAEDPNRLPAPQLRGDDVYNFWRDAGHPHGILRKTTLTEYLSARPDWHTVIDYDALGKQDNMKWVSHGLTCLYPDDEFCMVTLSSGGEDAGTMREFDLKTGKFVEGGFVLPRSK